MAINSGYVMVLVCHVISEEHVIKELRDFMGGSHLWWDTTLPSVVTIVEKQDPKCFLKHAITINL